MHYLTIFIIFGAQLILGTDSKHFNQIELNPAVKIIANILHDIVDKFYLKEKIELNILSVKNVSNFGLDIISDFMSNLKGEFLYSIETFDFKAMNMNDQFPINRSSIIFLNSLKDLIKLEYYSQITRHQNQAINFFIFIQNLTLERLLKAANTKFYSELSVQFGTIFQYAFFVTNEEETVTLSTVEYYSPHGCNQAVPIILNIFHKKTEKWTLELKNYEKFLNYHGCELVLLLPVPDESGTLVHVSGFAAISSDDSFIVYGIVPNIFRLTAKYYNYTTSYQPGYVPGDWLSANDMENVYLFEINGYKNIPTVFFQLNSNHVIDSSIRTSNVVTNLDVFVVVTPAEKYTPYEKIFLPFATEVWIALLLSYIFITLFIISINYSTESVKLLFYGNNSKSPLWDVISIFFGVPQDLRPDTSFPRVMLISFTYFCLVFRTCYQSKFFEFMTSEPRRTPPKSIADVLDREYDVYSMDVNQKFSSTTHRNERWINATVMSPLDFTEAFLTQSQNSSAKMVLCVDDFFQNFMTLSKNKRIDWNKLEDTVLYTTYEAFQFRSYSFYYRMFKNVIDNLIPTGIMNRLVEDDYTKKWKFKKFLEGPKVLSFNDLSFGFNIWLCACLISFSAFVVELLCSLKQKKHKKLKFAKIYPLGDENDEHKEVIPENLIKVFRMKPLNEQIEQQEIKLVAEIHPINQNVIAHSADSNQLDINPKNPNTLAYLISTDHEDLFGQKTELENDFSDMEDLIRDLI